jgi:HTH-type transcriptional regulator, sugar sensing transcriptional regulator
MLQATLKKIGFSADELSVYFDLLGNSPTSVRALATRTGVGRGTVFNILKKFIGEGLASHYRRGGQKLFTADDPQVLSQVIKRRQQVLQEQQQELEQILPELRSYFTTGDQRPKIRYFEGTGEVSAMLRDVLETIGDLSKKEYYVYSTKGKRQIIYTDFPDFSEQRIKAGIKVKVIAIGRGGELRGLDERRWLSQKAIADSSYMVVYADKVSLVTLGAKGEPVGVIIEDRASAKTQKMIFEKLWQSLK